MATVELGTEKVFGFVLPTGSSGELVKQTVISIMTAVFLLTIFLLFVFPRFADLAVIAGKVRSLEQQRDGLVQTLSALDDFAQNVSENTKESVMLAIPTQFDPGYILLSLRRLAAANRVSLVNYSLVGGEINVKEKSSFARPIAHPVEVSIAGKPEDMVAFVDSLGLSLPIAAVVDLSISEVSRAVIAGTPETRLDMALAYYHMPPAVIPTESLSGHFLTSTDKEKINSLAAYARLSVATGQTIPVGVGKESIFGL